MPVFKHEMSEPNSVDEFTTQAANAAQLVPEDSAELDAEEQDQDQDQDQDQPLLGADPVEDAAQDAEDEACGDRGPPQTREAYLKKGEDLIRSLL
jgi:hypothetical protein